MNKKELREKYKIIRKNIINREEKEEKIINKLKEETVYKKSNVIAIYKNLPSEVKTEKIINYTLSIGKIILLPKVTEEGLKFYQIDKTERLIKSNFGVEEPVGEKEKYVDKEEIDLMILPGICFDEERNRIGFGMAYYDKYLQNTSIETIALCFEEQILKDEMIDTDKTDIKVKKIITDKKIYK
ncbi:MAG: 5-formyltetrahydrofolate cyclo-ligase [Bacilli bacterium]|nr:5-formyltetrahydrofolate cyclo-ligase [Bacilli bacterium]